jgi:hypothetical protein
MRWLLPAVNIVNVTSGIVLVGSVHAAARGRWTRAQWMSVGAGVGAAAALALAGGGIIYVALAPDRAAASLDAGSGANRATVLASQTSTLMNCGALAVPLGMTSAAVYGATQLAGRVQRVAKVIDAIRGKKTWLGKALQLACAAAPR